jgi:hypothetical protein
MELPESLDETYERILKEIKKPNKRIAQRVLRCLIVAIRPLRVKELAEVLAVDFDDAEGIPRSKPDWRWEDRELALLSACSSLISIVEVYVDYSWTRVVQFSHFSVKEFLTSPRLASPLQVERFQIIISIWSLLIRSWRKLAWAFYYKYKMALKDGHLKTIRWFDTLPSTGRLMHNLGRCHHAYTKG